MFGLLSLPGCCESREKEMSILGILILIAVLVLASFVFVLALCKSMSITDDMAGTRE
jgi:hypothetical protein